MISLNVGIQAVVTLLGLSAVVTNIFKKKICWVLWSLSNIGWVWLYMRQDLKASIPIMVIYTLANVWGWIQWTKDLKRRENGKS